MQGVHLDHATINTVDVEKTVTFFEHALGLRSGHRPESFEVPGAWLYPSDGDYPIVHLMGVTEASEGSGNVDHIAFRGDGLVAQLAVLEEHGEPYDVYDIPDTAFTQVHVFDPNGVKIEITFEEKVPAK
jgi:catechol 2,3-dioxygenase-like lactoylglutathione lyase family enzyme